MFEKIEIRSVARPPDLRSYPRTGSSRHLRGPKAPTDEAETAAKLDQGILERFDQRAMQAALALVGGQVQKLDEIALAYNGLAIARPDLTKLALAERTKTKDTQQKMF